MQLTFDIPNLNAIVALYRQAPDTVEPILQKYITASQAIMGSVTGQNTPYQTGGLIKSFIPTPITPLSYAWGPHVKYQLWVEQGTGIYGPTGAKIVPINAKALAWPAGAATHFFRSVKGMMPRLYMEKILAAAKPELETLFEEAERQIIIAMQPT